jgi:hypothetical protein
MNIIAYLGLEVCVWAHLPAHVDCAPRIEGQAPTKHMSYVTLAEWLHYHRPLCACIVRGPEIFYSFVY